ncbi:MAG: hypothetical protein MR209_01980, partial [Veillonellaceae bacterium]|nr:hypothetical protein [Veillonellaceae bacterium]
MKKQMLAVLVGMSLCAMPIWAADGAAKEPLKHVDLGGTFNYAGQLTPFTNEQVLSNIANLNETLEKTVGYTGVSEAAAFIVMEEKSAGFLAQLGNLPGGYGDKAKEMYNAVQNSVKDRLQKRFGVTEARLQEVYQEFKAAGGDAEKIAAIGKNDGEKRLVAALQAPGQARVMETTLMNALPNVQNTVNAAIDQVNENTQSIADLQPAAAEVGTLKKNIATLDSRLTSEVNRLDTRIDRVGALTGALAGLKPIQYDPAAPTQIMAAVS